MSSDRFGNKATLVITDAQWAEIRNSEAVRFGDDAVILTVPNDATFEQRERMALRAAQIRHGVSVAQGGA